MKFLRKEHLLFEIKNGRPSLSALLDISSGYGAAVLGQSRRLSGRRKTAHPGPSAYRRSADRYSSHPRHRNWLQLFIFGVL